MTFLGNLKIGAKIAISIALLSVMALAIAGIAIQMMSSYQSKIAAVRQASVEALIAQRINGDILAAVMESRGIFMAVEDPAFLRQFADGLEKTLVQMTQRVAQLRAANGGGDAKEIDAIAAAADRFAAQRRELIQVGLASGAKASMELGYSGPNKESRVALSKAVEGFADENQKKIESLEAGLEDFRATRLAWLIALATGGIGLSIARSRGRSVAWAWRCAPWRRAISPPRYPPSAGATRSGNSPRRLPSSRKPSRKKCGCARRRLRRKRPRCAARRRSISWSACSA